MSHDAPPPASPHDSCPPPFFGQAAWEESPELTPGHLAHAVEGADIAAQLLESTQSSSSSPVHELLVKHVDQVLY